MRRAPPRRSLPPKLNLNEVRITNTDGPDVALTDPTLTSGTVTCHFRDIQQTLIRYINQYECVAGCVAWLTDPGILRALTSRTSASIVVQKEDFLRPDSLSRTDLRFLYNVIQQMPGGLSRGSYPEPLGSMNMMNLTSGDAEALGIRCVGVHNSTKDPAAPRSHHKFLVFGHTDEWENPTIDPDPSEDPDAWKYGDGQRYTYYPQFVPDAVWTGSFNFTVNAGRSLENAVFIRDPVVAAAYLREFAQVTALSEPLDWYAEWVAPEYRIGT